MGRILALVVVLSVGRSQEVAYPVMTSWAQHNLHHIVRRAAQQVGYGAPAAPASDSIDLHNKEFCVDVSTYQPVVWVEREAESCETVFVKQCSDRSENVCQDVTETKCEVRKQ